MMNLPNQLSVFRLATAPFLLLLAWYGYRYTFLGLLALSLSSDVLDGYIARKLNQQSELGAKLDSWGDFALYITVPLGGWWLWPDLIKQEALYFVAVIASYTLPAIVALLKFGSFTSYHTWGVKLAAFLVGSTVLLLFAGGPAWPFRLAAPISILAALEEIAITLVLPGKESNVRSLWDVLQRNR